MGEGRRLRTVESSPGVHTGRGVRSRGGRWSIARLSGGEALARSLVREGVEVVFGLPGIQTYGLVAGLRDEPGVRLISTRHEQVTTYMADGYARASGKPGVALVVPALASTTPPPAWPRRTLAPRP